METITRTPPEFAPARRRLAPCLALCILLAPVGAPAQGNEAASTSPQGHSDASLVLSNAALLTLMTNFSRLADRLGLDLQVDKLTLDLNGFALVGFHNSLSNLTAQQQIPGPRAAPPNAEPSGARGPITGAAAADLATPTGPAGASNACLVLNGLSLALATNVNVGVERNAFRVRVGSLLLRLNGFALLGLTNSLDGLRAQQELPLPAPPESPSPQPCPPEPAAAPPERTANR